MRPLILSLLAVSLAGAQALPIDCEKPQLLTFSAEAPQFFLTFQGQASELVLVRFFVVSAGSGFTIRASDIVLRDVYGNLVPARNPDTAPSDIIGTANARLGYHFDLPRDGPYELKLAGTNPSAGATIVVSLTRINRPCGGITLTCGKSVNGIIPASSVGQMNVYQYPAQAGDSLEFRLLRVSASGPLDNTTGLFLAVYAPDGAVVNTIQNNRLPFVQTGVTQTVSAKLSGTYSVAVWEATGTKGGSYFVAATRLNGGCGGGAALTCSSALPGQITSPLSHVSYTLSASAGDIYQFRVGRAETTGTFVIAAEIYDAQGVRIDVVGPAAASGHGASSKTVKMPATGNYTVMLTGGSDGGVGTYTIATTRINRPCADAALTCSSILDGALAGLVRNKVYSLDADAGDTFLMRLLQPDPQSLFKPRVDILDAGGTPLQFVSTTDLARVNFTSPAKGTYTFLVYDYYDAAQSGNFSLSVLRLNRPCNATALSCGGLVKGALTRALDTGVYTWNAAAGESFSVRMLGGEGGVLPSLELYDASGAQAGTALSGAASGADVVQPAAGGYTIVALDNNRAPSAGSYSTELLRTRNACAAALPQGQTVSGVVSATAPYTVYTVAAEKGDTLALRSASSSSGFSAQMELYDPNGRRVDAGVFGLTRGIDAAGTYTVVLGAAAPRTAGGYALVWQLLNRPAGTTPLVCGGTTGGSLAGGNQFRYYSLSADAGDTVRLLFNRVDASGAQMELFGPNGARITATSDVLQKASAGGNYLVLVSPSATAAETASYTLSYQRPNNPCSAASLTCGQSTLKQVLTPGQLDTFTFNGTGGEIHNIRIATRSGTYAPAAELYDAAGTRLNTSTNGQIRRTLPASGVYALLLRDSGGINTGSYRISLQNDSNTCTLDDKEAPLVTLVRPTGGEVLPGGATFRIQWASDDNVGVASQDIALSTDGGTTFDTPIASGVSGNGQTYDWILPPDTAPTRTAMLRITATDAAGNAQSASSDLLSLIGSGFSANASASYQYDALNRLIQAALGDGRTVTYTWDSAGNLVSITLSGQ